ncbi:hypothetical protein IT157_01405, partial [bacterium]|nr:hypothetical protein [bacterium]
MKRILVSATILVALLANRSGAQSFTHEQITSFSYEDASDLLRLFPGMYPMDYGVLGAPMIIRPWGLSPWLIGAERDGIPWNRVSDGLWNSNLDMPDEMDTLQIVHTGTEPFGRFSWSRRVIPSDSQRTELHVREGYYGLGRVDFAHAQRFSPKVEAEASGRLNWYDGMRVGQSKARLYNLRGSVTYTLSEAWKANIEYGGANSDVQSPHTITVDSATGATKRIS